MEKTIVNKPQPDWFTIILCAWLAVAVLFVIVAASCQEVVNSEIKKADTVVAPAADSILK